MAEYDPLALWRSVNHDLRDGPPKDEAAHSRQIWPAIPRSGDQAPALDRRGHSLNRLGLGNGRKRAAPNDRVKIPVALTKKRPPPISRPVSGCFNRLVTARIAPYFPSVGFASPARQRRYRPSRAGTDFRKKSCCRLTCRLSRDSKG